MYAAHKQRKFLAKVLYLHAKMYHKCWLMVWLGISWVIYFISNATFSIWAYHEVVVVIPINIP